MKEAQLKETYSLRVQFREQVQNTPLSFTISPTPTSKKPPKNYYGTKYDQNSVFVMLYLPSTISDTAVKKVFLEFGMVHTVFAGTFKDDLKGIRNGKRHIRLTPHGSKHNLPHQIQFPGDDRFFNVLWAEKIINCKECYSDHMLSVKCEDAMAQQNECPDKEDNVSQTESAVQVMGPSDPEVVTKPSIPPVDHDIVTQNEMPDNPMVPGLEESDHATGPVTTRQLGREDIPDKVSSDSGPILPTLPHKSHLY